MRWWIFAAVGGQHDLLAVWCGVVKRECVRDSVIGCDRVCGVIVALCGVVL